MTEVTEAPRYHVEGQTSTDGARWQIWDGEQHFARFRNIADMHDAARICAELNATAMREAALVDERALDEGRRKALRVKHLQDCPSDYADLYTWGWRDALAAGDVREGGE